MNNYNIYKTLRVIRNLKPKELAEILETSPSNISSIEVGRHKPSRRLLRDYAKALGVTPEFIHDHESKPCERYEEYLFRVLSDVLEFEKTAK